MRRLAEGGNDYERALIDSAQFDRPDVSARKRTLVALGLGTTIVGAGATVSSATAAATFGGWALMKWVGIGIVAGLTVVSGAERMHLVPSSNDANDGAVTQAASPNEANKQATPAVVLPGKQGDSAAMVAPPPPPSPAAESPKSDAAEQKVASSAPPPKVEEPKAVASKGDDKTKTDTKPDKPLPLGEEMKFLTEAQKALGSGSPQKALDILAAHEGELKMMGTEATILKMDALAARGDKAGAAALANTFLAQHPKSPYANHVRSLLAGSTSGSP